MKNLNDYLRHIGVTPHAVHRAKGGMALVYSDAPGSPPIIRGKLTFGKLIAALKMWPQLRDVVSRTVLVGSLIGIDVPGGKRIFPRE